ncbi:hypothetical protein FQA39_LY09726 [Lamprigera yunnana]|nr:hypothetical protein FQA39_LY09726 [Lamprigera yunnana]
MELDTNLLSLQSSLRNLEKSTSQFYLIKYKGGNEEKIKKIVDVFQAYLTQQEQNVDKQQFLVLLILNTKLGDSALDNVKELEHLYNVFPILSACLLAHIMVEVDLLNAYGSIIPKLFLNQNKQILFELEICLKDSEMAKTLKDTCIVLNAVISYFSSEHEENETLLYIGDIFNEMLKNLARFNQEKVKDWTFVRLQGHIGYTLLNVLQLLNKCPVTLNRLICMIINIAVEIMKVVTVDVFCVWAEVNYEDGTPLQLIIAGEAYVAIEHLQKYKPGIELAQMLASIAKKPKTLSDKILEADVATIIMNVDRCDENQLHWFRALLNTNIFENKLIERCVSKWYKLCTPKDVLRVFQLSLTKDKKLALKCATILNPDDLMTVVTKYFWGHSGDWNLNIDKELTILFNKIENNQEIDKCRLIEIYLLLMQNREMVLHKLCTSCLSKSINVAHFKYIFHTIQKFVIINNFAKTYFIKLFQTNLINDDNILAYKELINMVIKLEYFSEKVFVCDIIKPQLQNFYQSKNATSLLSTLKLLNLVSLKLQFGEEISDFIIFLLMTMEEYRTPFQIFLNHTSIIQESVTLILKYAVNGPYPFYEESLSKFPLLPINKFYATKLWTNSNNHFLKYLFLTWNNKEETQCITGLIKVLPMCIRTEWCTIANEMDSEDSLESTLSIFSNFFFIFNQLVEASEEAKEEEELLIFCLHQYQIVIKEILQERHKGLKEQQMIANHVCRLLKDISKSIRQRESVHLINLLSDTVLKSLRNDRDFILAVATIQDTSVCQLLAQKMLS